MKSNKIRAILLVVVLSLPLVSMAKGGSQHVNDMKSVFPFANMDRLYRFITDEIDNGGKKPDFLYTNQKFSNLKWENHRIWYHWGFYSDPLDNEYLKKDCIDYFVEHRMISESERILLEEKIRTDWSAKRQRMLKEGGLKLKYSSSSKQLEAFVAIMYSIHILGDYTTDRTYLLCPKQTLYENIYRSLEVIAGGSAFNRAQFNKLKRYLKSKENKPDNYLNALADKENGFSQFLMGLKGGIYDYKKCFERKGVRFKVE